MSSYTSSSSDVERPVADYGRYLRRLIAIALAVFLAAWLLVALLPMAVLNVEYPVWMLKKRMAQSCDIGSVMVLGDSRALIGIIPALLSEPTTNLAIEGSTPIEAYYVARSVMHCAHLPKRVIVSFSMHESSSDDFFWDHSVRFGFLSACGLREVEAKADQLHDPVLQDSPTGTGTSDVVASWLFASRFPTAYFRGLASNGLTGYFRNVSTESKVLHDHGHWATDRWRPGSSRPHELLGVEASLRSFSPSPVVDDYLNRLLTMLLSHGTKVYFVVAPISGTDFEGLHAETLRQYAAYLNVYGRRYPQIHMVGLTVPHWPNRYFADIEQHMTRRGATLFTEWLNTCLQDQSCDDHSLQTWPQQMAEDSAAN